MPNSHSSLAPRPSLGHRSISEQAPLYDPSSAPQSGSRLRGSKAVSGAHTATGYQLPYSPLLPLPPASASKPAMSRTEFVDPEQTENAEPGSFLGQHDTLHSPSALAARRLARRGVSETLPAPRLNRTASSLPSAVPALSPKIALRLDIAAASDLTGKPAASKSAGMIRSYSLPVATQAEHDEQQRIMALGLSPVSRPTINPSWWQYGWPSPGGINHRHVHHHHQGPPVPEFVGQRRRSSQSKLSSVLTPIADAGVEAPRPSSRSSKARSSCSPKMKAKHVPSIHQHSFQTMSSRSASMSPKTGRSPLSMMSVNLPALDQQHLVDDNEDDDDDRSVSDSARTPAGSAFDIEMDALNQRFAEWSRSQATPCARPAQAKATAGAAQEEDEEQDDYFNLVHDDVDPAKNYLGVGSDTSDEARTPRASSPRPLSKAALYHHDQQYWASTDLEFIHPDHLS